MFTVGIPFVMVITKVNDFGDLTSKIGKESGLVYFWIYVQVSFVHCYIS